MRTIYAKKMWFPFLSDRCIALSFGSLSAMRRSLWGDDAYVVRCLGYLFRVSEEDFLEIKNSNI